VVEERGESGGTISATCADARESGRRQIIPVTVEKYLRNVVRA
jgi:hypothetical protein